MVFFGWNVWEKWKAIWEEHELKLIQGVGVARFDMALLQEPIKLMAHLWHHNIHDAMCNLLSCHCIEFSILFVCLLFLHCIFTTATEEYRLLEGQPAGSFSICRMSRFETWGLNVGGIFPPSLSLLSHTAVVSLNKKLRKLLWTFGLVNRPTLARLTVQGWPGKRSHIGHVNGLTLVRLTVQRWSS